MKKASKGAQAKRAQSPGKGAEVPEGTLIGVILDRSGSMDTCVEATIAGFNQFLRTQQRDAKGGRALMSLIQFDDQFEVNFVGEAIENVPKLDTKSYVPRGSTALHDAIGRTIRETEAWVREHGWNDRVLILIITDGQENASEEYDLRAVRALIKRKERVGWNFAYMGANQDSFAVGGAMGVRAAFTQNYAATSAGLRENFAMLADTTSRYRHANRRGLAAHSFFDMSKEKSDPAAGKLMPKAR